MIHLLRVLIEREIGSILLIGLRLGLPAFSGHSLGVKWLLRESRRNGAVVTVNSAVHEGLIGAPHGELEQ